MNYLANDAVQIKPIFQIHAQLQPAFLAFVLNDGYLIEKVDKKKKVIHLTHLKRDRISIKNGFEPNEAAKKRYQIFLKLYIKHGKTFVEKLNKQINVNNVCK